MAYDEYARWRDSTDCGHMTGTVHTGPQVCGKPAKFTVDLAYVPAVDGCTAHHIDRLEEYPGRGFGDHLRRAHGDHWDATIADHHLYRRAA